MTEKAQKIYDAWNDVYNLQRECYAQHIPSALAATLRELVKQYAYNNFHIDGDHGIDVMNVKDILKLIDELDT
jgi:hypothetical protein